MNAERWEVESLKDGWAVLKRKEYVFVVPMDRLPEGVERGVVLHPVGGADRQHSRWVTAGSLQEGR